QVSPVPDEERPDLVVGSCEWRTAIRLKEQRRRAEVVIPGRGNGWRLEVECRTQVGRQVNDVVAVTGVVDVAPALVRPAVGVPDCRVDRAVGRIDGDPA